MIEQELRTLGHDCYAAFNQRPPEHSSRAWTLWAELCTEVPLEAAPWIRARILEQEACPRNFGRAVLHLFYEWRVKSGYNSQAQTTLCGSCDRETPGFYTAYEWTPGWYLHSSSVRCPCNTDSAWRDMLSFHKAEAERRGYMVKQHGESLAEFEAALLAEGQARRGGGRGGVVNPGFDRVARTMSGVKSRARHMDYAADAEGW